MNVEIWRNGIQYNLPLSLSAGIHKEESMLQLLSNAFHIHIFSGSSHAIIN